MSLEHPVALVLGAGQSPGREIALTLARRGFALAVFDFSPLHLDTTLNVLQAAASPVLRLEGDPIKKIGLQALFNTLTDTWGRLDAVITALEANPVADVLSLDEWDWHRALDINLSVPFLVTQVAGRVLRAAGGGVVVHLGLGQPQHGPPGLPYLCGKTALLALVPTAAAQLAPYGVHVHAVLSAPPGQAWPGARSFANLPEAPAQVAEAVAQLCRHHTTLPSGIVWHP